MLFRSVTFQTFVISSTVLGSFANNALAQHNPLLDVVPASSQSTLNQNNWTYSQTNSLDLSGSTWSPEHDENDVYHAALKHDQQIGTASQDWEIRIGKGGQIYSIRSEVGEIVPPQHRPNRPGFSPWNDEVFQSVSVDTSGNPPDVNYFYHQSGYYVDGVIITEPTYSPLLASGSVGNNAYSTLSLGVQPKANDVQQPSGVLNWQRTKDLGDGVVEITNVLYNFGNHTLNFHNMPWGGSRKTVFSHMLVSNSGGGFTDAPIESFGEGQTINSSETDGWVAFAEGTAPTDRAMALVIGNADEHRGESWQNAPSDWRWGGTGTARDFLVGTFRRRLNVDPGDVFYSRYYMVLGEVGNIEALINVRNLSADATYDKIQIAEAGGASMLGWNIVNAAGIISVEEAVVAEADFLTFAQPVNGSQPLFLLEDAMGNEFISTNPYVLSDFPYDGATTYHGLLGFVMPESLKTDANDYTDLAEIFGAHSGYYPSLSPSMFAVSPAHVPSDANGDGIVNNLDIASFALALFQPAMYEIEYPNIDPAVVLDMNHDGVFNNLDISGFAAALGF